MDVLLSSGTLFHNSTSLPGPFGIWFSDQIQFMDSVVCRYLVKTAVAPSKQEGPVFEALAVSVWSFHVPPILAWLSPFYSGFPHHHRHVCECVRLMFLPLHLTNALGCVSFNPKF